MLGELDRSVAEYKAGNVGVSLEEISREFGLPEDEKDEVQTALQSEIIKAEIDYNRYCNFRERKRILECIGEKVNASFTV